MPGGLFPDEAANGLDINLMQQGNLQPFYERGNGREALFFYMLWGSVEIFGKGPWQMHAVSALVGTLSVLLCFLAARRLMLIGSDQGNKHDKNRAANIALLASFLMAVSSWHVVLSRTAFRAVLIPLFTSLTVYLLVSAFQTKSTKGKLWLSFLSGASFALGFYTYIAYRIMAPIILMILVWPLLAEIKKKRFIKTVKTYFWPAILFAIAFIIFVFPLGKYFYDHPGSFIGRAGQVSIFNQNLYTIDGIQLTAKPPLAVVANVALEVFKTQFLGFFTHGDLNWRQNISGSPFLSILISPFFAVALLIVTWLAIRYFFSPAKKSAWWKFFLLAGWFWAMLLPVVTTAEGIPHGLRGIGVIPPVFIISALGLYWFGELAVKMHYRMYKGLSFEPGEAISYNPPSWMLGAFKAVVAIFVIVLVLQTYFLYFVYAANSPENFYYFRSDLTPVSRYLAQRCDKQHTYLILDKFSVQTTDFLTSDPHGNFDSPCNVPYRQVDPENSWQLSALKSGDEIVFTQSSMFDTVKFKQYHPNARLSAETRNQFGQAVMAVYTIE
ncbi:MAG: glycosyltransferase family 39 protein [Patescibacteria group bacterium]|nr:glycosyltransferase family 39 protein [Patescibacteria group bacterium]